MLMGAFSLRHRTTSFATASRGFGWSLMASLLVMLASLVAQFFLGRLLSIRDFGVYAIAISCANMVIVFRDGGVAHWLGRMTADEFQRVRGNAMCLAFTSSLLVGALLATVAYPIGWLYGEPQVSLVLLVLAASFPLGAYAIVGQARLQVELRFETMATIKLVSGYLRYGLTVLLAARGWGPLSFAWPVLFVAAFELVLFAWWTRLPVRGTDFSWSAAGDVFKQSKWSLSGSFSAALLRQCDYAVLGLLVPTSVVGAYYFAFQLAIQPVQLIGESLRKVVLPLFARVAGDAEREQRSLTYAGTLLGIVAAPLMMLLVVTGGPLLELLWGGKWAVSAVPLQLLAFAMPIHLVSVFCESLAQSRGQFRLWTVAVLLRGIGLGIAATLAAAIAGFADINVLTLLLAFYLAVSGLIEAMLLMRWLALPLAAIWNSAAVPIVAAGTTAILTLALLQRLSLESAMHQLLTGGGVFIGTLAIVLVLVSRHGLSLLAKMSRMSV